MIRIMHPGFFTTIQDAGRKGYRHLGIPVSGAMDQYAYALANALLPHPSDHTVFECTFSGPTIYIEKNISFVVTGAPIMIQLAGELCEMNTVYLAKAGNVLTLGKVAKGVRSYLRFSGELQWPKTMGSISLFHPITSSSCLVQNDCIDIIPSLSMPSQQHAKLKAKKAYISSKVIDVVPGPDWNDLPENLQKQLLEETHRVAAQNRMGYSLTTQVEYSATQLLSQVVIPGMVQLTPGKKLLVATADCQVTGGYLQVLQILPHALNTLVQKPEHSSLIFRNKQR